jgi:DMSO/TMAO reductase YedYZ molybdopterin-dependent catalytic subunit
MRERRTLVNSNKLLNGSSPEPSASGPLPRRSFLKIAAGVIGGGIIEGSLPAFAAKLIQLPFENGSRELVRFPQKGEMILLRERPPLLETPFEVFDRGVFTPNDQFFVRWHLPGIPTSIDVNTFRLRVDGRVRTPIEFTLKEILRQPEAELAAVNQCSGNSRGFSSPRVPGGEWGNGAMGNALWTGVTLKSILDRAGVLPGAVQVRFNGLDTGEVPETPLFMKSLAIDHAMDGEVMVAYGMNGTQLPMLNGFPLRLVVPGWYSTYWVKMLSHIEVLDKPDDNYWMHTAYLIPDTPGGTMVPDAKGVKMIPINRMVPRSFITNLRDNATVRRGVPIEVRGIAFGGDTGVKRVAFSSDGGSTWENAALEKEYGRYSFRRWQTNFAPKQPGTYKLMANATNSNNLSQPAASTWNPGGYMRNVIERVTIHTA